MFLLQRKKYSNAAAYMIQCIYDGRALKKFVFFCHLLPSRIVYIMKATKGKR